jgi:integrase
LPDVRSDADCRRLIATLEKPVYRGCFTLIYAYGLRITEAVTLPVSAVDSKQMVLRVIGKRNKERILPLTESILRMLREVWKTHRSRRWLFASCPSPRHPYRPRGNAQPVHSDREQVAGRAKEESARPGNRSSPPQGLQ